MVSRGLVGTMANTIKRLIHISVAPLEKEAFDAWLKQDDAVAFLKDNAQEGEFVVYASFPCMYLHSVLVPTSAVNPPDVEDLMNWNCNAGSSWGIETTFSEPQSICIVPPLDHTGTKSLDGGEQLVFMRSFEGRLGKKGYCEILQKFTHVFDLHFLETRNAYCRLDRNGDIEEMIRIVEIPVKGDRFGGTIVTFNRRLLDEYLTLTDSTIVRTFDITRHSPSQFGGWSELQETQYTTDPDLFYRSHVEPEHASYMRGCQIVPSLSSKESLIKRYDSLGPQEEKQYASFIAHDWKNKVVKEISCAPGQIANYFTNSDLPFETSPAFFKPGVLSKYKADSEKYRLTDRSISCRGGWHLQTYDINEAGQVHTYLIYLSYLPYEEQLYWKSYNEKPKAGLSKRAVDSDFKGEWNFDYDPLPSLKAVLHEWDRSQVPWWSLRSEKLPDQVHYPVTPSPDEWANEILNLDQLCVEGFETKWLRTKVEELGRNPDVSWASLRLIEEFLVGVGCKAEDAKRIVAPLKNLHSLRTKLKGHASGDEATEIKKQTLKEYGSYEKHFRSLSEECDQSVRTMAKGFDKLIPKPASAASQPESKNDDI
jgi:hypothetical protein